MIRLLITATAIGWVVLFASSKAVLVWGERVEPRKPGDQATLACHYFTGTGVFVRTFWYNEQGGGFWGVSACPRIVGL
jgi:hypothetical protein